jgi:transposase
MLLGMGIRELRAIQTVEDLKEYQPEELLNVIHGAIKEFDTRISELENKLNWATQQIALLTHRVFGTHSERTPKEERTGKPLSGSETPSSVSSGEGEKKDKPKKDKKPKVQKPSERYPNLKVLEEWITSNPIPCCPICQAAMKATGMTEDSEALHVIPKQYVILRKKRMKYACSGHHGSLITANPLPCILPGATYSDDLIIDVTLSKYCDLIPVERYASIAERLGVKGIPPHSLIEGTHHLATLLEPIYLMIRMEVLVAIVLAADETPHRMLEGSAKKKWFLWGFSSRESVYYETHSTRAGEVAVSILSDSKCEVLLSDVYSGYSYALKEINRIRLEYGLCPIIAAYCNAHSRRKFKDVEKAVKKKEKDQQDGLDDLSIIVFTPDYKFFLDQYKEIYLLEEEVKGKSLEIIAEQRQKMIPYFEAMRGKCEELKGQYPNKHLMTRAMNYFVNNYEGLTWCLWNPLIPLDNNQQEARFRNPAIGRGTWLGTHSKLGAKTAAIHFTLVESCKQIGINPREYYKAVVADLITEGNGFTPLEWKKKLAAQPPDPWPPDHIQIAGKNLEGRLVQPT